MDILSYFNIEPPKPLLVGCKPHQDHTKTRSNVESAVLGRGLDREDLSNYFAHAPNRELDSYFRIFKYQASRKTSKLKIQNDGLYFATQLYLCQHFDKSLVESKIVDVIMHSDYDYKTYSWNMHIHGDYYDENMYAALKTFSIIAPDIKISDKLATNYFNEIYPNNVGVSTEWQKKVIKDCALGILEICMNTKGEDFIKKLESIEHIAYANSYLEKKRLDRSVVKNNMRVVSKL